MTDEDLLLLTPGPTILPLEVRNALLQAGLHHREPRFRERLAVCLRLLRDMVQSSGDVFLLCASGRGGLEAAIVNAFSPGDGILAVVNGHFGSMFARIARDYALDVRELAQDWSRPVSPEEIVSAIRRQPEVRGVLVVHSETSTGVLNDVRSIAEAMGSEGPVLIVDAMSSLGSTSLDMRWGLDAVVSCSQKGLMCPPGVAVVATSKRYQTQSTSSRLTKSYWDFGRQAASLAKSAPETHNTAPVPVIVAMAAALELLVDLGFGTVYARTASIAERVRRAVTAMGLRTLTEGLEPRYCSPTVTTVVCPEGLDVPSLLRHLREHSNVMFARGLGQLAERTFRIGHMGAVSDRHLVRGLEAVDQELAAFGWRTDPAWRRVFDQLEVKAHES